MTLKVQDFKQLRVWNHSMNLANGCYAATDSFPDSERYGLISQIRRASTSIASNIAEGCGRDGHREFARFLRIAYGSACELETQLILARRQGLGDPKALETLAADTETARRMLSGLIRSAMSADTPQRGRRSIER
jgi:four helix bundle protein